MPESSGTFWKGQALDNKQSNYRDKVHPDAKIVFNFFNIAKVFCMLCSGINHYGNLTPRTVEKPLWEISVRDNR